ncbi:T9SS type A sorting domain-containing protein, partial [candidate division WOR-3 bacterium]|nr:T9SS type A sorting domain-containing protein [candidate division WOR-3 bacterium]
TLVYQSQTLYSCDDARINEAGPDKNYGTEDRMWACDHGSPQKQASYIEFSAPLSIEEDAQKKNLNLLQITPNPFTEKTSIEFEVRSSEFKDKKLSTLNSSTGSFGQLLTLKIYDLTGQLVKTLFDSKLSTLNSQLSVTWDGKDESGKKVTTGIYFCSLETGKFKATKKLTILR